MTLAKGATTKTPKTRKGYIPDPGRWTPSAHIPQGIARALAEREKVRHGENGYRYGETHHNAKVSDHEVAVIRDLHELHKWPARRIAEERGHRLAWVKKVLCYQTRTRVSVYAMME